MPRIIRMKRLEETVWRSGGSGDNWHMTWADDDKVYTGLCDGRGWETVPGYSGKDYNTRVYAINGAPPHHSFEHLPGFPDLLTEPLPNRNRYYGFGILALEGAIYHFLSTPNRPFEEPEPRFVGTKLIYSPDNGGTWRNQDGGPVRWEPWVERNSDNMLFFNEPNESFQLITVLQMGQNYRHNRDGFVYLYAPNGNTEGSMNQTVLCRVPRERILDRSAYTFFAGRTPGGEGIWSKDIRDRVPVHTFPSGWVNTKIHPYAWHPSVVYYAPLGVYLMANWGMGCAPDGMWFGKPSYLGFWTSPTPWGPWEQVHEETAWMPAGDEKARAYQPQISPKWIAPDGSSFWMVWTDFQSGGMYYCFNTQKVEVTIG